MVKAVTYILENNSTVQGLVGLRSNGTDYKVYPVMVPQSEKEPYIVVRQGGKVPKCKGGDSFDYTVEVLSYAISYDAVTTLAAAVKSALEGQATATVNGVAWGYVNFTNELDSFSADHGNLFVKIQTYEGVSN